MFVCVYSIGNMYFEFDNYTVSTPYQESHYPRITMFDRTGRDG